MPQINNLLHHNGSDHARVNGAGVAIGPGLIEADGEALVGIQRSGAKQPAVTHHGMWLIVLICPGDGRAGRNCQRSGPEHEILRDHDGGGSGSDATMRHTWRQSRKQQRTQVRQQQFTQAHAIPPSAIVVSLSRRPLGCFTTDTLVTPSMLGSCSAGTLSGPGPPPTPATGCGYAVERAVWNVTLPSTFCTI